MELLNGLRVLDISRVISGPYCGMTLADLGADVVKVEKIGDGDDSRSYPPFYHDESLYYYAVNRNKRGISVDFRSAEGQEILLKMAENADVLIENFRPGTIEKMGLGYERLKERNPGLIMASISGFGATGPYRNKAGYDAAAQAMSGVMSMTGQPDGPPVFGGVFYLDFATSLYATIAILSALNGRHQTGRGQHIDVSLLDSGASFLLTAIQQQLLFNRTVTRVGNRDRYTAPANVFKTRSGHWLMLNGGKNVHFKKLIEIMGMPELLEDERFREDYLRVEHATEIEHIVQRWMLDKDTEELVELFGNAGLVCAKVETLEELVQNPQLLYRKKIIEVDDPVLGKVPMFEMPMSFSGLSFEMRFPPPRLGEHTEEVLMEWLNMTPQEIAALQNRGIL